MKKLSNTQICLLSGIVEVVLLCQDLAPFTLVEKKLREAGFFLNEVADKNRQDKYFARLFSAFLIFNQLYKLWSGFLLDRFGIWATKFSCIIVHTIGLILMIIMTITRKSWLAFLAVPICLSPPAILILRVTPGLKIMLKKVFWPKI